MGVVVEEGLLISGHLEELEDELCFCDPDCDCWVVPLGNNWLITADWAKKLSKKHNVSYGRALDIAQQEFWPGRRHPEWE